MRTTFPQFASLLTIGLLVLSACNMPTGDAATKIPSETDTPKAMTTIAATATLTKLVPTATITLTATETPLPESATPEPVIAKVVRESNCRVGPGSLYDLVARYQVGQMLEVVAKDLGNTYWFVKNPESPEEQCYLLAQNVTISGETTALPRFTPLPSPTAQPYYTVEFKKLDKCNGVDFALFTIENVGSVPFRSVYIKLIGTKGDSVEQVLNAFDLKVRCVLAKNIAPLDPGGSGYVYSPPIKWAAHSTFKAIIMVCTEKNLKGTCITQSVDVRGAS
jgi:hypothetical protein